jgi:hypothetical protein
VDLVEDLLRADTVGDATARRWQHMLPSDYGRQALVVTLEPYAYPAQLTSATHGTSHDYDARVPLVFYGPGFASGRFAQVVRVVDLAPTLAARAGVRPSEPLDGRVLREVLTQGRTPRD